MLKFSFFFSMLICCAAAQAEDIGPWFGGEVALPQQVSVYVTVGNSSDSKQNPNCTIYSCPKPKNIVKPELKSAANP
jgi:hypothetical protein